MHEDWAIEAEALPERGRIFCIASAGSWRARLDTRRFRAGLGLLLNPLSLKLAYASPLVGALPSTFGRLVRSRLERGFARHSNRRNPYARFLLLGEAEQPDPRRGIDLGLACADAAAYLERCPPASFDGFALSNILDGASASYHERLLTAVRRAAAPGAALVRRSFGEPASGDEERWAARDRSLLWGSIRVEKA